MSVHVHVSSDEASDVDFCVLCPLWHHTASGQATLSNDNSGQVRAVIAMMTGGKRKKKMKTGCVGSVLGTP